MNDLYQMTFVVHSSLKSVSIHDYMPITRNLSDKSVEEYKQSIKVYLEFLEVEKGVINEKVTFDSFTRENIKEFIAWLTEKNCSKHSKAPQK